jgi:hypothetical protein
MRFETPEEAQAYLDPWETVGRHRIGNRRPTRLARGRIRRRPDRGSGIAR